MRNLTSKQKALLLEWAKANKDLVYGHKDPVDNIPMELWETIEAINPCEILWQNANSFLNDLTL